jgi:16S rRNA (uracil1498-N3)-methyltransferase
VHRFFVPPDSLGEERVSIRGEVAQQIRRVLRMRPGDTFYLLDGLGYEYLATLVEFDKDSVWADVQDKAQVLTEPAHKVSMYLSLLNKPDKFEYALQKCTELGAARFVPIVTDRSVTGTLSAARHERWERIIQEAAEQSGRGLIPALDEPIPLQAALKITSQETHIAVMPELGGVQTIAGALKGHEGARTASILIGPEGGFAPSEVSMARGTGVSIVSLGARTLRAETAAIAALTLVLYELGEIT